MEKRINMTKLKFKVDDMNGVRLGFIDKVVWLRTWNTKKDIKCENCGILHEECDGDIAICQIKSHPNLHLCDDCGKLYISLGVRDYTPDKNTPTKEDIIGEIRGLEKYDVDRFRYLKLESMEKPQLLETLDKCNTRKIELDRIDGITLTDEEKYIEDYLIEYGVLSDTTHLKCEEQIDEYFMDVGREYLDCGQGYFQDTAELIIKIGFKFYNVFIEGEVCSSKQDYGDRLYWIEDIENVTYSEVEKPRKLINITDWFDPCDTDHIDGYIYYSNNDGKWQDGFLPEDIRLQVGWIELLAKILANKWVSYVRCTNVEEYDGK